MRGLWGLVIVSLAAAAPAAGQTGEAATRARLATLLTAAPETPGGQGLLPTGMAEARVAIAQSRAAGAATTDLAAMQMAARNILHALDPAVTGSGPGLGYGLTRAVADVIHEVQLTAAAETGADVQLMAPRALRAAAQVQAWATTLVSVAQQVVAARTAEEAAALVPTLQRLAQQLVGGVDADRDGQVTFAPGEGGLLIVQLSLGTLFGARAGEGPASWRTMGRAPAEVQR